MSRGRIAVVGGGIAGLTAGYVLARTDDVVLFDAESRLGGHAHAHELSDANGADVFIDSGFVVHNRRTYPLFTRLLTELGVAVQPSEMSMSMTSAGCGLAYAGRRGAGLAAGLRSGGSKYAAMLAEVLRFHRRARRLLARHRPGEPGQAGQGELTLGQFLAAGDFSQYFIAHFALPFAASVWSCPPQTALSYPARYPFAFVDHHGLLAVTGSPKWLTITGGSRGYAERAGTQLAAVRAGCAVMGVRRLPRGPGDRGPGDRGPDDRGPDDRGPGDRGPGGLGFDAVFPPDVAAVPVLRRSRVPGRLPAGFPVPAAAEEAAAATARPPACRSPGPRRHASPASSPRARSAGRRI